MLSYGPRGNTSGNMFLRQTEIGGATRIFNTHVRVERVASRGKTNVIFPQLFGTGIRAYARIGNSLAENRLRVVLRRSFRLVFTSSPCNLYIYIYVQYYTFLSDRENSRHTYFSARMSNAARSVPAIVRHVYMIISIRTHRTKIGPSPLR